MAFPQSSSSRRLYPAAYSYRQKPRHKIFIAEGTSAITRSSSTELEKGKARLNMWEKAPPRLGPGSVDQQRMSTLPWLHTEHLSLCVTSAPPAHKFLSRKCLLYSNMQTLNTHLSTTSRRHSHQSSQRMWVCCDSVGKLGGPNKETSKWRESHLWIFLLWSSSLDKKRPKKIHMMRHTVKGYPLGSKYAQRKH